MAESLCAANLIPINKKDGGIRPIAVGDTIRRVVGKVLLRMDTVTTQLEVLAPRQCGVGVPYATEMVGMGMQRIADTMPNEPWVALQVDMRNAFNCIDRVAVLEGCKNKAPSMYNWMAWCYRKRSPLFCQGDLIAWSEKGMHQGDAMGPCGFALGLEVALDKCVELQRSLTWQCWYLDDGTFVGPMDAIVSYLEALIPALHHIGLEVNLAKCALWGPGVQQEGDMCAHIPEELPEDHPIRRIPVTPFGPSHGITFLGVPVDFPGSSVQVAGKWEKAVAGTLEMLERLRLLPDGQLRHCLLRHCLDACRVQHLMRSTPRSGGAQFSDKLSDALRVAVADLVGCGLTGGAWDQATLPISQGGLGIRDPAICWAESRLAALVGLQMRGHTHVGLPSSVLRTMAPDLSNVLNHMQGFLGPNHDPVCRWVADPSSINSADESHAKQSWWAEQVAEARRTRLHSMGTARDQVRLANQEGPLANGWISIIPSHANHTILPDTDFRSLCRFWLGLPLLPEGITLPECPLCHESLDPYGDHFVTCRKNGSTRRHNALRDAWVQVLLVANVPHIKEVPTNDGDIPADILLVAWDKGRDVAVDFTICSPCTLDNYPLSPERARRHLAKIEAEKTALQKEMCEQMGWGHHPAGYSPWGGQGAHARSLLYEVLRRATADLVGWPKAQRLAELRQNLALTLAREVARQLAVRCQVIDAMEQA